MLVFRFLCSCCLIAFITLPNAQAQQATVRVAVVGGIEMSGVWSRVAESAEEALGITVDTVMASPKEGIVPAFMNGHADLLLIHGGDETFALQAMGYADALRTWGYNEFAIVGPEADPAGVMEAASGKEAVQRIQESGQPIMLFRDPGSYNILQRLLEQAGLTPADFNWVADGARRPQQILRQASEHGAYALVGHIPVAFGRMPSPGMSIMVTGDPVMRRAYVVASPGKTHPASASAKEKAGELADYLLSQAGQAAMLPANEAEEIWILPRSEATIELTRSEEE
jgi:tungstate transport system substrate-binding protein